MNVRGTVAGSAKLKRGGVRTSREVAGLLRERIVGGALASGDVVPRRVDLQEQFGVSTVTMQRAMDLLRDEGFICVQNRQTRVSARPPHLFRYAMVFPWSPSRHLAGGWSRWFQALANEAAALDRRDPRKLNVFLGIDGHADNEDFQRLVSEVQHQRYAGLIFTSPPDQYVGTPLLDEPGIARVAMMPRESDLTNVATIDFDGEPSFDDRAVDYLISRGRRRIACIYNAPRTSCAAAIARRGLEVRSYWQQIIYAESSESARGCAELMFRDGQVDRPDGLIIADDNAVEYATAGLVAAGMRVPADLDVVAHTNFPYATPSALPVKRLGYDIRQFVATSMELIDEQRQGRPLRHATMAPVFEDEVAGDATAPRGAVAEPGWVRK